MQKQKAKTRNSSKRPSQAPIVTAEERHRMIAEAAYFRALSRGFQGGSPEDDWFAAEREVAAALLDDHPVLPAGSAPAARATRRATARKSAQH
ncbi:MAG TPA: DUF2934 domain-containing protein [Burkholderiales bacterium]